MGEKGHNCLQDYMEGVKMVTDLGRFVWEKLGYLRAKQTKKNEKVREQLPFVQDRREK